MLKYRTRIPARFNVEPKIEAIEVERESAHFVWVDGRREAKESEFASWFDSFEEAADALFEAQKARVLRLQDELEQARRVLAEVEQLECKEDMRCR